jgi:aspartyl protease family protein
MTLSMTTPPDWQQLAIYAVAAAVVILLLVRIPFIGRAIRFVFSLALLAFFLFLLVQQAPYQPELARFSDRIGLDRQEVVGEEVRVRMAPDGHFWVNATINGVKRRMLVDSGATVTAISDQTATSAAVDRDLNLAPIVLRTANGLAPARPASVDELRVGNIVASNLKVVTSPALGNIDILGMNFLSKLASWRVEGRTLVLVPHHPRPAADRS